MPAPSGPGAACWTQVTAQLSGLLRERGIHPARTVVLLPYAQLMREAKAAWAATAGATHFLPRFETTMNWATRLGGSEPAAGDLRQDAARDILTAASLLARAGLGAQQEVLAPRLVEAASSLARLAAQKRRLDVLCVHGGSPVVGGLCHLPVSSSRQRAKEQRRREGIKGRRRKVFAAPGKKFWATCISPLSPEPAVLDQPSAKNRRERGHGRTYEHERTRHDGTAWRPQRPPRGQ